jgi:phenylacetate-coenzyme A ligase PaaK-like adenylate-forming protein
MFSALLAAPPYSLRADQKSALLLSGLNDLAAFHYERCEPYRRILDGAWGGLRTYAGVEDLPYIPVGLFKELELTSNQKLSMVLHSSGTTGQRPSRIYLDPETAARQAQALVATFEPILGRRRLPFLAIDTKSVITAQPLTARGAGVLGMMKYGARTTFALDGDLAPNRAEIADFVARFGAAPFLIFGFTFLVWTKLYQAFEDGELDLSNAILVHSGGWKKLEAEKVSNEVFRASLRQRFGLTKVFNFYGFVEQIGSVFVEGEDGRLYPPNFADVIIRDPETWRPVPVGQEGVIQVLSLLPTSYPGHSVLTEDWGVVDTVDAGAGGRYGKAVRILGRVPKAELRGCSDVIAASQAEAAVA